MKYCYYIMGLLIFCQSLLSMEEIDQRRPRHSERSYGTNQHNNSEMAEFLREQKGRHLRAFPNINDITPDQKQNIDNKFQALEQFYADMNKALDTPGKWAARIRQKFSEEFLYLNVSFRDEEMVSEVMVERDVQDSEAKGVIKNYTSDYNNFVQKGGFASLTPEKQYFYFRMAEYLFAYGKKPQKVREETETDK